MSVELLELGAAALGELLPEVVFAGGASIELWISDPAAPPVHRRRTSTLSWRS